MRAYTCASCGQLVFFENTACLNCGAPLGFRFADRELVTLTERDGGLTPLRAEDRAGDTADHVYHRCGAAELARCNWLVVDDEGELCASCRLTRTRPADEDAEGLEDFAEAEQAKRRLLFTLGEFGLPIRSWREEEGGLAFDLLSSAAEPVTTGHASGVITLDLAESDDAHRERMREELGEPYRTLLGHFRHEVGHYYWERLVPEGPVRDHYRTLFGDEREDYGEALERHYARGPEPGWPDRYVSAYATMHPWEDWAETFAHYLHIWDTVQTAASYGVRVAGPPGVPGAPGRLASDPRPDRPDFDDLVADWLPLTYALNALNRSMGQDDLYPFVLAEEPVTKLCFIHDLIHGTRSRNWPFGD